MNILVISQRVPYPPNKGEKLRTYFQIKHLLAHGHMVSICTPAHSTDDIKSIQSLNSELDIPVTHAVMRYRILRLVTGLIRHKPLSVSNFYSGRLQKKLDALIENSDYDAILCTSSSMAEYVFKSDVILSRFINNPNKQLLMDFMDLDSDKWQQYSNASRWPMKWIYAREARLLAKVENNIQQNFDHCFLISQNELDLFHNRFGPTTNVHVLGNGIDTNDFYPATPSDDDNGPIFIFTGVMDYKPNIDAVLWFVENVWEDIRAVYPGAQFIVAGMNPTNRIHKLSELPGIEVTGFINDIIPYYHKADYFVAPFTIARGVQNKVLQAFACGLPVISSPMGVEGINSKHGQHIIIAYSGQDYLDAVEMLESDNSYREYIKNAAQDLIREQYSWESQLKVLDELLSN